MATKRKKVKGEVTRLVDLEVDEVSLVDKPAIGEQIYLTKSIEETEKGGTSVAKKKVTKSEGGQPKPEGEEEVKPAPASAEGDDAEGEESEAAEGEEEGAEGESEAEGEGEAEPSADVAEQAKRLTAVEKNMGDLQEMLAASLEFHDQAAQALNQVMALTMGALEMIASMAEGQMDEPAEDQPAEAAAPAEGEQPPAEGEAAPSEMGKAVSELRKSIQTFQSDVQKAGAKISSARLTVLRDIAEKLTALIQSVASAEAKAGKKGGKKAKKKSIAEIESLKQQVADLKKSFSDSEAEKAELKKQVTEQANRLGDIETSAGASTGIDEDGDEEETPASTEAKNKSVFSGLIPVDDIKTRVQKRQEFLNRKSTKET